MLDKRQGWLTETSLHQLVQLLRAATSGVTPIVHSVVAATTEAESYTDRALRLLVQNSTISGMRFGTALIGAVEDQFHRSWDDRLNWLSKGFGIDIGGHEVHSTRTLADLRNAIVHGGGKMTSRQRARVDSQVGLERRFADLFAVRVEGGVLHYGSETSFKAIEVAREYVVYLDRAAREQFPELKL
ncbi:MAG: hypothetical protein ACREQV_25235 [Candidatus Binatia bacterium]